MGYGYLLLDAIDPVEEVGDLAGDSVLRRTGEIHRVFFTARQKCDIPAGVETRRRERGG